MHTRGTGVVVALALLLLAACGGGAEQPARAPVLHWYVGPDRVDTATLARACTDQSEGSYRITVVDLPADVDERRADIVRRLLAQDDSIDILSVDTALTAELGAARLLAPVPKDRIPAYTEGVFESAIAASTHDGELVTVPWWYDPWILWYRGTVAERAGLDTTGPITWDALLTGAERIGATVQIDDDGGAGLAAWVNALVAGGGTALVDGTGRSAKVGLDTPAGRRAASVVEFYAQAAIGEGPSPGALRRFASPGGAFLLAPSSVFSDPVLAPVSVDLAWTAYPVVEDEAAAPLSGVGLGVPLYAPHSDLSYDAIECLTSATLQQAMMLSSGHSAARESLYETEEITDGYPLAEIALEAVRTGAPEPSTPYWHLVRRGIDQTWRPLTDVRAGATPKESQTRVRELLTGALG